MSTHINRTESGNGIGLGTILFIVFLVLKLCHVITWSWLWVFAPIWIPLAFAASCFLLLGVFAVAVASNKRR